MAAAGGACGQAADTTGFRFWSEPAGRGERDTETLRINEICPANNQSWPDENGQYNDWIELHNFGEDDINLMGRWLSDNPDDPYKHQINENVWVAAGGYIVLFADNNPEAGALHLNFSLSADGEHVLLSTEDFLLIDELEFEEAGADMSWGYVSESGSWALFTSPTPMAQNTGEGNAGMLAPPGFSQNNLFFTAGFDLTLSHPETVTNYYTTDGSAPTTASSIYMTPITIVQNTCVRAKATGPGLLDSPVETRCYAVQDTYELDIICVTGAESDFWGTGGIYSNAFSGLEKRVSVVQYAPDGTPKYDLEMGVKIHAPDGRQQKSLRFYARSEYGSSELNHALFPDNNIAQYKRFILRNAGNDGLENALSRTGLRDPLISWLYGSINDDYGRAAYEPVHLMLNGEYWGIYNMRERQDEHYIKSTYGYESDEIDYLERTAGSPDTRNAIAGTWADYDLMHQTAIDLDLSQPENYAIMEDWMDMENFTDYKLTEIFICNQDWLSNNMKFWKPHDNSRKWEWIIWDTDWGFGTFYPSYPHGLPNWNALNFSLSDWGGWTNVVETHLLQNLTENPEFLAYFCTRAADLHNSYFLPERIIGKLHDYRDRLMPDIPKQFARWGSSMLTWTNKLNYVEEFVNGRPANFLQHFTERFDLGEILPIHLEVLPAGAGYIEVNTIQTDSAVWEGLYFEGIPVRIKAVANPGYTFSHWSNDTFAAEQMVNMTPDLAFTAFFEEFQLAGTPVINEINYHPADFMDAGEWVEIKNNGPGLLDLSGWTLEDENAGYAIPAGTTLGANEFLILCSDTVLFKALYPTVNNYLGNFSFGLSNSGGTLSMRTAEGLLTDIVTYSDSQPWPASADGAGGTLELIDSTLDNAVAANWFVRPTAGGTPGVENLPVGLSDAGTEELHLAFYPNPLTNGGTEGWLLLGLQNEQLLGFSLYNALGQTIGQGEMALAGGVHRISLAEAVGMSGRLHPGLYKLEVRSTHLRKMMKIVVSE